MTAAATLGPSDWIGIYGAVLSTLVAVVGGGHYLLGWHKRQRQLRKFQTDLYFLRKIDRATKKVEPIVAVLLANLGSERVSIKSLEYEGIAENGITTKGAMGWYEQPEEAYGIRKRLLPLVLEPGQTADLPMIYISVFTRVKDVKIWLTDFDDRQFYIEQRDIDNVRREIEKFLEKQS
jgi:hypothetical protein